MVSSRQLKPIFPESKMSSAVIQISSRYLYTHSAGYSYDISRCLLTEEFFLIPAFHECGVFFTQVSAKLSCFVSGKNSGVFRTGTDRIRSPPDPKNRPPVVFGMSDNVRVFSFRKGCLPWKEPDGYPHTVRLGDAISSHKMRYFYDKPSEPGSLSETCRKG